MPVTLKHVAIAKVGEWPATRSDGSKAEPFTEEKFDRWISSYAKKPRPAIGIGHIEDREANGKNGTPALGGLSNLVKDQDPADGVLTLYADLEDMPSWLPKAFPQRSVEVWQYPDGDESLARLAMLGDEIPAVYTLQPTDSAIEELVSDSGPADLVAAAASGAVLVTGAAVTTELPNPSPSGEFQPSPNGPEPIEQKEPGMSLDPKLVARSLGLPEDADEATINAKLAEAGTQAVTEAETATETAAVETPAAEPVAVAAAAEDGAVKLDAAAFEELKADAEAGRQAREEQIAEKRATLISAAASDGRIPLSRTEHYAALHVKDPEGTEAFLNGLEKGVCAPVGEMVGHSKTAAAAEAGAMSDGDYAAAMQSTYGIEVK